MNGGAYRSNEFTRAQSFGFKLLPLVVRQPRYMMDYPCHFALFILNERHLRTILFEEEICFGFGIKIRNILEPDFSKSLPD